VVAATALAIALGLALLAWRQGEIELDPAALRDRIERLGWLGPLAFLLAAAIRQFLVLPSGVVMAAGGLLFGTLGGIVLGTLGFTANALFTFGVARAFGREAVRNRMGERIGRIDGWLSRRGARWIGLYTALPATPLTPIHATAGLTGISTAAFAGSVVLGLLPRTAAFSFFGDSFASGDWRRVGAAAVVLAVAFGVGALVLRWLRRREG
jgi:uncharacterized membrane protein YdjX (TVP38/TMEM64 family)